MRRAAAMAFVGFLVILAPFGAAAAVIAEQPVFTDTEHIIGDTPLIFSGASGRTPSLLSLLSATGTVKTAKIRYNMPSWPGANGLYAYLYECPLHVGDTLPQCRRIVSHDAALGWDGSLLHPPVENNGELTIGFNDAQAEGFGDEIFTSGVPLNPARGYRLEAVFTPNTFNVDVFGSFGTTSAGGFYPYFKLEGDGAVEATTTPDKPDPVIIIPGILGSYTHNGVWDIDPVLHSYDDLIDGLKVNGYQQNIDLFTFPYDWRKSNVETAVLLKGRIDQIKAICNCQKVDIVAHSMGGLVARKYIQSPTYDHDIDQIIFLGTPHLGAPKAYLMWEGGEFGTKLDPTATLLETLMGHEAHEKGFDDIYTYLHEQPIDAVRELLPVYSYLFDGSLLRNYPDSYPTNVFLEDLNSTNINLSGVRVTNVVGSLGSQSTPSAINVVASPMPPKWTDGYPVGYNDLTGSHGLEMGEGDGTVPLVSAGAINQTDAVLNACHISLPSFAKNEVFKVLTGKEPEIQTPYVDVCNARIAIFQILSPADIEVISPDGKKIGSDFESGGEINEITGGFYSGADTAEEYVTIPNPIAGQYKIITKGKESGGAYTLRTTILSGASTTISTFTGTTTPGLVIRHEANLQGDTFAVGLEDTLPPEIVFLSPATSTYSHAAFLPIQIKFTDISDLATSEIMFDSAVISNDSSIDLFFRSLGVHSVSVSASDRLGNSTSTKKNIEVVATIESTKSDLARIYSMGWIKKDLRNLIAFQLNQASVLKRISVVTPDGSKVSNLILVIDKVLLRLILKELQIGQSSGAITTQGYEILFNDISWIISHN